MRTWFIIGSILAGLGVLAGAFGAHGLKARISPEMLVVFETGARYQLLHALALLAVGVAADRWPGSSVQTVGWLFVAGIVLFSGSLYALAITGVRMLGAITPFGGLCFIIGWFMLAFAAWKSSP